MIFGKEVMGMLQNSSYKGAVSVDILLNVTEGVETRFYCLVSGE